VRTLLIRADASATIGTGHVMRCLALAQAWQATGGSVVFLQVATTPAIGDRLRREGIVAVRVDGVVRGSADDARETIACASRNEAAWIAGDGYDFGADWQRLIKDAGFRLLLIDDYGHATHYWADLLLNPCIRGKPDRYSAREPQVELLTGLDYVLLRKEFSAWRTLSRPMPAVARRVLVTLGGGDAGNVTLKAIEGLARLAGIEVTVVVGGSNPNQPAVASAVSALAMPMRVVIDAENMPELMAWADIAVAAAGSTSWELGFMGLPSIVMILADNQEELGAALADAGLARCLGRAAEVTAERLAEALQALVLDQPQRQQMSLRGKQLIDGIGAQRVATRMQAALVRLRPASQADCRTIWDWANAPEVRDASFSSAPIPWDTHLRWYAAKIANPNCCIYIAGTDNCPAFGQVRFDVTGGEATISVSMVRPEGKGWGAAVIARAVQAFWADFPFDRIHAYIKAGNRTSLFAFEKAGFRPAESANLEGHEASHLTISRSEPIHTS
jgi:UDP-2,4-diacetamido-2,4,6-trideoxy-beta-L-altropyranose hydrolase